MDAGEMAFRMMFASELGSQPRAALLFKKA